MEKRACFLGHGFSNEVVVREDECRWMRCPECQMIYLDLACQPYGASNGAENGSDQMESSMTNQTTSLVAKARFDAIYSQYPNYHIRCEKALRILEIGCGRGQILKLAKAAGLDVYGLEADQRYADYVNKVVGIPCETGAITERMFDSRTFDIIYHSQPINRLRDPVTALKEIRKKLEPHGQFIFETRNEADVESEYYKYFRWKETHITHYLGERSIRELLKQTGFTRIQIISWSILPELIFEKFFPGGKKVRKGNRSADDTLDLTVEPKATRSEKARDRMQHFLRYTVGALSSNKQVPRSMLVWAMK